jgi:maltokinase
MVKWSVALPRPGVRGAQPAADRIGTLMTAAFAGTPRPWGLLRYVDDTDDSSHLLLASVAEFLPGAEDGWDWAVEDVRRLARRESSLEDAVAPAARLGELTARMHQALASTGVTVADDRLTARWTARAYDDLDAAVQLVDGAEGVRLRARAGRIAVAFSAFRECVGTPLIDVHGDLHVGQVLRHGDPADYSVTDFDGNPVLAPTDRSAPQPAALDVAGMLASLDHVGRVVVRRTDGVDAALVRSWISAAQDSFLAAYRSTLASLGSLELLDERLLVPLRLQQECREYLYAVHHLPHWRYVPDAALVDLLPDLPEPDEPGPAPGRRGVT